MRSVLHVGCGGDPLPAWLSPCVETRLDISPDHNPDVLASMTAMGDIGPFDAVYSCHSLEHLYPHEVGVALSEFFRVLKPGGMAAIMVPDLEGLSPSDEVLFRAPCGPVTGFDLFYGLRCVLAEMPHMAHHSGFVEKTLRDALLDAGFAKVETRRLEHFNLFAVAAKA